MSNEQNIITPDALLISERRRRDTQRLSGVGFWELNHKTSSLYWSEEIFAIYGMEANEIEPNFEIFASLIHDDDRDLVTESYLGSVENGTDYDIRYRIKAGDSTKWIEAKGVTYYDDEGNPERSIGTARDISEIIDAQKATEFLATHDALTGLPNRSLFADRFKMALRLVDRNHSRLAVLFIDLDNFKLVNDHHGHNIGDEVLTGVADQLRRHARASDTYARIGGDEFVGILSLDADADVDYAVQRVKDSIEKSYKTQAGRFKITASIGVTVYPHDHDEPDVLLRHADHAMYEAKEAGKSGICYFDRQIHQFNISRNQLLREIEQAIDDDEFVLHYQPKISLANGIVAGAEALLRWFRANGPFSPADIISAISGTSLEWELDTWVFQRLLADRKRFDQQLAAGTYGFNVNSSTVENKMFPQHLSILLEDGMTDGKGLEIEILEVSSITNIKRTSDILSQCKALGFSFSLDDFGTGYSSLTYFHSLPIDKLKIDQKFIKHLTNDRSSRELVKSILAIAKANKRPVVAEGVESYSIAKQLLDMGCEYAQGFGIARPMAPADYIDWVNDWKPEKFTERINTMVVEAS